MYRFIPQPGRPKRLYHKILLVMRLTAVFLIASLMQVSAAGMAQKVSLSLKNASLETVIRQIKSQTGYNFVVRESLLNSAKPVTISVSKTELTDVLDEIFENQPLTFAITDKTVVVKEKTPSFLDKVVGYFATVNVRGRVVDENFQPLQGASVTVKNGKGAVNTDVNGLFYLKNVEESATLVFTYIGFTKKEIAVESREDFGDVRLEMSSSKLDEVQIQFSGVTSRRTSTSNIATIKGEEIAKQPVDNPLYALIGRVPGLIVTPTSGMPNAPVKVQLRGQNSLNAESEPLFVIDGVPYLNNVENFGTGASANINGIFNTQMSLFSFLNPGDIESIDVLKDADATAIYGSRGANGVILITTKKGKIGETTIDIGFNTSISSVSRKLDLMNTEQYLAMRRDVYIDSRKPVPDHDFPNSLKNSNNYDLTVWDANRYTDWQDVLLGGTAKNYSANAGLSGGTTTFQYSVSGNYNKLGYVFPGEGKNESGSGRFSLSANSANQRFRASMTGTYSGTKSLAPADYSQLAISLAPNAPALYNSNGELNWEPNPTSETGEATWNNPYRELLRASESSTTNLVTNLSFSYAISPNLFFKTNGGFTNLMQNGFTPNPISSQDPSTFAYARGNTSTSMTATDTWSIEPQINYKTAFGGGRLDVLIGGSWQGQRVNTERIDRAGFSSDALLKNHQAGQVIVDNNISSDYKYIGGFARLNYNWKDKYIVNLNARRDGSSRFGPGNQFGNFGSIGAAWVFSNEMFWPEKQHVLSFGKLRFSYGTSGNDGIGDYRYLELFGYGVGADNLMYQNASILSSSGVANPDFHWENKQSVEIGTDLGFFKDRILFSGSYFYALSTNQLVVFDLPYTAGATSGINVNQAAKLRNSGLEFNLTVENIKGKKFGWTSSGNISILNRNKLLALGGGNQAYVPRLIQIYPSEMDAIGKPIGGVVAVTKYLGVDPLTGLYSFADKNGNPTTSPDVADKFASTINITPQYYGGISNQLTYGNFSLSFYIQFTKQLGKSYFYQNNWGNPGLAIYGQANQPAELVDRWSSPGNISRFSKVSTSFDVARNREFMYSSSDASWVDASFIRMKNVAFSYRLPNDLTQKLGLRSLNFNLNVQNLFTITGYKGLDVEMQSVGSLAPMKTINTGLQIGF